MKKLPFSAKRLVFWLAAILAAAWIFQGILASKEKEVLKRIVSRLKADSRIAQALVTDSRQDPATGKTRTTIKFLEFDSQGQPLAPKYFTFSGDIIQFQSLVVRFEDFYVEQGDPLRGRSAYLFLKVFFLDGANTQIFDITPVRQIPSGYQLEEAPAASKKVEAAFWEKFWDYALDPKQAKKVGIKNAQIEAPGTKFVTGVLYTIKIEHDGGMRIDAQALPDILKGERMIF